MSDSKTKKQPVNPVNNIEDYKSKYLRALADYQNLERRVSEIKETFKKNQKKETILKLLSFLDNLEKAEIFHKDEGLKMVKNNFYEILKSLGIKELEVLGKEFDPYTAEAIDIIEGEKDNFVVEVLRKGYGLDGEVLRVANVKVSKKTVKT